LTPPDRRGTIAFVSNREILMRAALLVCLLLAGCSGKEGKEGNEGNGRDRDGISPKPAAIDPSSADKPAAFDPSSADNTLIWLRRVADPVLVRTGNGFKDAENRKTLDSALEKLAGKRVSWPLRIASVSPEGRDLKRASVSVHDFRQDMKEGKAVLAVTPRLYPPGATTGLTGVPFHGIEATEWVRGLRPGDTVKVEGVIEKVVWEEWYGSGPKAGVPNHQFLVVLNNPSLAPPR
jgi:hypothetical protein